jgi:glycosyltransferase involved in cell wall biosynthesis
MCKISIITVNYNDAAGLERTINSVINQTSLDFEYIVIDGGSNDGSLEVIKKYQKRINFFISEKDSGIYNAMNKGIKVARGDYLFFLNSGDHFFDNDVIKNYNSCLQNEDLVYFNVEIKNCNISKIVSYPSILRFSDFYIGGICHQSVFIKKTLFEMIGLYDEDLKIVSDWKFFILVLFKHNCSYKKVNGTLSTYYLGGISSQINNFDERSGVLKEHFKGFVKDYEEFLTNRNLVDKNRFRMLQEIEKSIIGTKLVSIFFRIYIILFCKTKLKDLLSKSIILKDSNK